MVNYERLYHACILESSRLIDVLDARAQENPDSRQGCFEASSKLQKLLLDWEEQYIAEAEEAFPPKILSLQPRLHVAEEHRAPLLWLGRIGSLLLVSAFSLLSVCRGGVPLP